MGFLKSNYIIVGHNDERYIMTAERLHERILEDSKSDYNWIAPADSLVNVCDKAGFPEEYALDIKCAILNCFANIEHRANTGGDRYIDSYSVKQAVWSCYNSLYGCENEKAIKARERYLKEIISTSCYVRFLDSLFHPGPTFQKMRDDWIEANFEKYIQEKRIDFQTFEKKLHSEFAEIINKAEEEGAFDEDKKADQESWQMFYRRMIQIK